jgi:DNA polymerase-3 subunit chi
LTQVFFYHGASDKLAAACALLGKTSAQKKNILVFADEKSVLDTVDRLLWTQSALSFHPHCRADSPLAAETPILLSDNLRQVPNTERLMNLGKIIPPGFEQFTSLIEVVGQEEDDRLAARDRVKHYKECGCEVRYFDLSER